MESFKCFQEMVISVRVNFTAERLYNWSPLRVSCFCMNDVNLLWVNLYKGQVLFHVVKVNSSMGTPKESQIAPQA